MIRKSFTKLKRIIFSGLVMSLCTFVFNPTTPANAAMVQESEPNDDWTTADNLSLNTGIIVIRIITSSQFLKQEKHPLR